MVAAFTIVAAAASPKASVNINKGKAIAMNETGLLLRFMSFSHIIFDGNAADAWIVFPQRHTNELYGLTGNRSVTDGEIA
jgi:hypothetical protein